LSTILVALRQAQRRLPTVILPTAFRLPLRFAAALLLVRFADELFVFIPSGSLAAVHRDLQLTYSQAGVLLTLLATGGVVGTFLEGAADHVSRRALAAGGAAGVGVAMIAFGTGGAFWALALACAAWGAAGDAFVHGSEVALVDLAGGQLTRALGRINLLAGVGDVLAPLLIAAAAILGGSWRSLSVAGGVVMIGYAVWLSTLRLPGPARDDGSPAPLRGVLDVLRDRRVIALGIAISLHGLLDEPFLAFVLIFLQRVRGLSLAAANLVGTAALAGGLVGYLLLPRAVRGVASIQVLLGGTGLIVLGALVTLLVAPAAWLLASALIAFGAAGAVYYTVGQAHLLRLRPGLAGTTGAVISVISLPAAAFPILAGAIADRFGLSATIGLYASVPVLMLAAQLVSGVRSTDV
jgi:predicted MFS family arabinose efflux permease